MSQRMRFVPPPANAPAIFWTGLRAGDLLLTHGTAWYSSVIEDITDSPWSHAAMVWSDAEGGMWVGEMTSPKARNTPLESWVQEQQTWCCRLNAALSLTQRQAVEKYWRGLDGKSYGYGLLLALAPAEIWQRLATWLHLPDKVRFINPKTRAKVCSVAVADAWTAAGLVVSQSTGESPADAAREAFVGSVEEVTW